MASTPQVAALGRRSSDRLTALILVLIAVVVIVSLTVFGHQVGDSFSSVNRGLGA
jgi:hypothetical protein